VSEKTRSLRSASDTKSFRRSTDGSKDGSLRRVADRSIRRCLSSFAVDGWVLSRDARRRTTGGWFLVIEDLLPAEIEAFEKWIPKNKGKVFVTFKSPTEEMGTDSCSIGLEPFQPDICVTLWGRMGIARSLAKLMPEDKRVSRALRTRTP